MEKEKMMKKNFGKAGFSFEMEEIVQGVDLALDGIMRLKTEITVDLIDRKNAIGMRLEFKNVQVPKLPQAIIEKKEEILEAFDKEEANEVWTRIQTACNACM